MSVDGRVKDAEMLLVRLQADNEVLEMLQAAVESQDVDALDEAVRRGMQRNLDVREAQRLMTKLELERRKRHSDVAEQQAKEKASKRVEEELRARRTEIKDKLAAAMDAEDLEGLNEAVK